MSAPASLYRHSRLIHEDSGRSPAPSYRAIDLAANRIHGDDAAAVQAQNCQIHDDHKRAAAELSAAGQPLPAPGAVALLHEDRPAVLSERRHIASVLIGPAPEVDSLLHRTGAGLLSRAHPGGDPLQALTESE